MTNEEAKVFLDNLKICINEHPIVADWLVEIADRKTENSSEKPNNCEHITEDGVTCAKYPACDDCLDNPLNKVKGSERLVKGSEQTEPQKSKWIYHSSDGEVDTIQCGKCGGWIEITIPQQLSKLKFCPYCGARNIEDEPQTDCAWR